jgi:hypothetical protein
MRGVPHYSYYYITKLCRTQAEVILYHLNSIVLGIGQGEVRCRNHMKLELAAVRPMNVQRTTCSFRVEVEVVVNLRPKVSRPVCPGFRRPLGTRDQLFFLLEISFRQLRHCYFVSPSLTRGRVCNLLVQLLLGLARAELYKLRHNLLHMPALTESLCMPCKNVT